MTSFILRMIISPFITCVDEIAMFETMVQAMRVGPGRGTNPAAAATVLKAMK
jgi:hypothetical protein